MLDRFSIHRLPVDVSLTTSVLARLFAAQNVGFSKLSLAASILIYRDSPRVHTLFLLHALCLNRDRDPFGKGIEHRREGWSELGEFLQFLVA